MTNTAQFIQASPAQKENMLIDGLAFVAKQMGDLERNARVLTGWMATYPYASLDNPMEIIRSMNEFSRKMDNLTAQLVNASLAHEQLLQYTKKHITKKQLQS